jgi:hypothetical protein
LGKYICFMYMVHLFFFHTKRPYCTALSGCYIGSVPLRGRLTFTYYY